jgi:large subunit ribosomal protein L4
MEVPVYNMKGSQVGSLKIDESALGGEINPALIKQAYVRYHTNTRQGSARTKNRHEVEGSTRKIYKQKGTGNARHGDKKSNLFKGGGHGHSKKKTREDFRPDMPKKMRRKANRSAFLAKLLDNEVRIIDSLVMSEPKTKAFKEFLEAIKVDNSAVVALNGAKAETQNVLLSGRNVEGVTLVQSDQINAFNMLNHRYLVIGKAELEAWLSGPSSQTGKIAKTAPLGRKPDGEAK